MAEPANPQAASLRPPPFDPRWALFLDLDGTLIDIAPRPELVEVPEGLVALLQRVAQGFAGALAVVSGRPLAGLDRLLDPWRPAAAGEHGAFCRLPDGTTATPEALPAVPTTWRAAARRLGDEHPGVMVEDKQAGITVHFRQAPAAQAAIRDAIERLVGADPTHFAVVAAHMALEIRPRGVHKGWAVDRLMREAPFRGRIPVFIGDDVTDEDGFRAAEALGGKGLHVHHYFQPGAVAVRAWLASLAAAGQSGQEQQ